MKKGLFLFALCAIVLGSNAYASVGKHNVYGDFSFGVNSGKVTSVFTKDSGMSLLGGTVGFGVGYQFFTSGTIIHGVDASFGMSFGFENDLKIINGNVTTPINVNPAINTTTGYVGVIYSIGTKAYNTRFMIDVIGLRLEGTGTTFITNNGNVTTRIKSDDLFNIGINLPLGFRAVMDNGAFVGFRHSVSINVNGTSNGDASPFIFDPINNSRGAYFVNYNFKFVVGYMFGK